MKIDQIERKVATLLRAAEKQGKPERDDTLMVVDRWLVLLDHKSWSERRTGDSE